MSLTQLLSDYGYVAVFVGSLLEGETILLLAGFAAHQGYLSLPLTVGIAFVGGTLGDQIFYWLGRVAGKPLLDRLPNTTARVGRVNALLTRFDAPLIVGIRFMYGLRILGPIVIGTSSVPPWRFAIFNIIGAAMWAPLVAGGRLRVRADAGTTGAGFQQGRGGGVARDSLRRHRRWLRPPLVASIQALMSHLLDKSFRALPFRPSASRPTGASTPTYCRRQRVVEDGVARKTP